MNIGDPTKESAKSGVCPTCGINPESVKRSWPSMVRLLEEKEATIESLTGDVQRITEEARQQCLDFQRTEIKKWLDWYKTETDEMIKECEKEVAARDDLIKQLQEVILVKTEQLAKCL